MICLKFTTDTWKKSPYQIYISFFIPLGLVKRLCSFQFCTQFLINSEKLNTSCCIVICLKKKKVLFPTTLFPYVIYLFVRTPGPSSQECREGRKGPKVLGRGTIFWNKNKIYGHLRLNPVFSFCSSDRKTWGKRQKKRQRQPVMRDPKEPRRTRRPVGGSHFGSRLRYSEKKVRGQTLLCRHDGRKRRTRGQSINFLITVI